MFKAEIEKNNLKMTPKRNHPRQTGSTFQTHDPSYNTRISYRKKIRKKNMNPNPQLVKY
jgi:hypothetical protein